MTAAAATETTDFNPDQAALLDELSRRLRVKNDAALARALEIPAPTLSKLRNGRLAVGAVTLIRMHEATGFEIKELRELMGDRRKHFRMTEKAEVAEA